MEATLLSLFVLAATAIWPLNRWAQKRGASTVGTGIVLSVMGLAGGLVGSAVTRQPIYHPASFFFGALGGIAYAVGFVFTILKCLSIGPVGPTVTAYALGLAGTMLATFLVPYAPAPTALTYAGFASALLAVVLLGVAPISKTPQSKDWGRLVVVGWSFAALFGATQFLSGRFAAPSPFGYIVAQYLVSLLLLLIVASTGAARGLRAMDLAAGAGTGILAILLVPISATLMREMEAAVFTPVTVVAPVLVMVGLGALAYRERLTAWGWIACAAGAAALVLLSLPHR